MNECCKTTTIPPKVEKILASCSNLPSLPSVVIKIIDASKDPEIGIADVADILSVDPALSAKLLRIANSSMYSRRRKITNLREALSLLGLDAALTISLSFSLVKTLSNNSDSKNNYDIFWRRSILSATIARQIALKLQLPNLEDFFIAGLLQDIGILAIDCTMMTCMDSSCESNHLGRIHCEKNSLGVDHSDVGAWLLKSWDLPEKLYKAVLCSHTIYTTPA
ncbi:MAG: HDOD domain-containing protein, partial [Gammaproteobacteria bacterium]|nr:HDOD domain-containing protein [Gammaproteobacteria bacterium]